MSVIDTIYPFNGRLVVEVIKEDVKEYLKEQYGMKNSVIALPDSMAENTYVPCNKGKILKMAPDAYGEGFKNRYGDNGLYPEVGDTILFVPMQSEVIDREGKYHLVSDHSTLAFFKATK
jgi:hypothetical protein